MKSVHRGVSWHKASNKWAAKVTHSGVQHHLGVFEVEQDAASAVQRYKTTHGLESRGDDLASRVEYRCDGALVWKSSGAEHAAGDVAGYLCKKSGYVSIRTRSGKSYAHRLIWESLRGLIPDGQEIDHINGRRDDNRIENLRLVTRSENLKNTRLRDANKTGVPGVSLLKTGRYAARIWDGGEKINLGNHQSLEAATAARMEAAKNLGYHANHGRKAL